MAAFFSPAQRKGAGAQPTSAARPRRARRHVQPRGAAGSGAPALMCSRVRERGEVATQRNCGAVRDLVRGSDKVAKNGQHGEDVQTSDSAALHIRDRVTRHLNWPAWTGPQVASRPSKSSPLTMLCEKAAKNTGKVGTIRVRARLPPPRRLLTQRQTTQVNLTKQTNRPRGLNTRRNQITFRSRNPTPRSHLTVA